MLRLLSYILTILQIVGLGIHIWTSYILFSIHGWFGAITSLIMPVISEVYLIISSWNTAGTILTQYNLIVFTYIISYIIFFALIIHVSKLDEIRSNTVERSKSEDFHFIGSDEGNTDELELDTFDNSTVKEPIKKKKMKISPSILAIISIVLIRVCFAVINKEIYTDFGLGFLFGNIVLTVVVLSAVYFLISKLNYKMQSIITGTLVLSFLTFMISNQVFVINKENKNEEIIVRVEEVLTQSVNESLNGKEVLKKELKEEEFGGLYEFTNVSLEYLEDISNKYIKQSFPPGIQLQTLYTSHLPNEVTSQRYTLYIINSNIESHKEISIEVDNITNQYVTKINSLIESEKNTRFKDYMTNYLSDFNSTYNKNETKKMFESMYLTYEKYCDILRFLIGKEGQYYIDNNQYVFNSNEEVDELNSLIVKFINSYEKLTQDFN